MSINDGRALYHQRHGRYTTDHLPPADTVMRRAVLRTRADRGDELAVKALDQWEAEQHENFEQAADSGD